MFIVVLGNITEGHTFHGPFASFDDAAAWADLQNDIGWVVELQKPEGQANG